MHDLIPIFDNEAHPWINRLLKEQALRCPACGAPTASLNILSEDCPYMPHYVVACGECKHHGDFGRDVISAIKKWNKGKSWRLQDSLGRIIKSWKRCWR